jgi:hypothetical protein
MRDSPESQRVLVETCKREEKPFLTLPLEVAQFVLSFRKQKEKVIMRNMEFPGNDLKRKKKVQSESV